MRELEPGCSCGWCRWPRPGPDYAQTVHQAEALALRVTRPHRRGRPEWVQLQVEHPWGNSEEWVRPRELLGEWHSFAERSRQQRERHLQEAELRHHTLEQHMQACLEHLQGAGIDIGSVATQRDPVDSSLLASADVTLPVEMLHRLVASTQAPGSIGMGGLEALLTQRD